MNIKRHFQYEPSVEATVSQIGISRWNWVSTKSSDQAKAKEIMSQKRFDVLPIENNNGSFTSYYCTQKWNDYKHLNKLNINENQAIYYRLTFKDLIRKFKNEERYYYFLTGYEQVLGLISYVNLNCQLVYNYLFFVISDIERSVSGILSNFIAQETILNEFENSEDKHLRKIAYNFRKSMEKNEDNNIFQQMYLQTIGITVKKFLSDLPDNLKKLAKFSSKFSSVYSPLRNKIMHPVRPILSDKKSIDQIDELLNDYQKIKNIVKSNY